MIRTTVVWQSGVSRDLPGNCNSLIRGDSETSVKMPIFSREQRFYVRGLSGLALLRLDDGTKVSLGGETRIEYIGTRGKLDHRASGPTQCERDGLSRRMRPLVIHTPNSQIEVLGTRLVVSADDNASELGVRQGRVRFQRLSDGHSIEVTTGQYAIASQQSTLEARSWPDNTGHLV